MLIEVPDKIPVIQLARFAAANGCLLAPCDQEGVELKLQPGSTPAVAKLCEEIRSVSGELDRPGPEAA